MKITQKIIFENKANTVNLNSDCLKKNAYITIFLRFYLTSFVLNVTQGGAGVDNVPLASMGGPIVVPVANASAGIAE